MTSTELVRKLVALPDVSVGGPASSEAALSKHPLPAQHAEFLSRMNGVVGYGGYFRLFGVEKGPAGLADLTSWNDLRTWKFAWPSRVTAFLCFGETAWGDQYAFAMDELGAPSPRVYYLEALMMAAEPIAESFDAFLENEFLRNCRSPYDSVLVRMRSRLGDLRPDEHLIYVPSPLITGSENDDHVRKMPAVASMVVNGDLATQLGDEDMSKQIERVEPYTDTNGRSRLRVVFARE